MSGVLTPARKSISAARSYISDLWNRREFAWYLAMGNLKARNATTTLGLLWWVLNPLLLGAVYWIVFGVLFNRRLVDNDIPFIAYLLSGMFPFFFTQSAMTGGVNSIVSNTRLLSNLSFPRLILPISALTESFVGFLTSLGVFYLVVGCGLVVGELLISIFGFSFAGRSAHASTCTKPIDRGQQFGRNRPLDHEGAGAFGHHLAAYALLVVDADDDHPDIRTAGVQFTEPKQAGATSQ